MCRGLFVCLTLLSAVLRPSMAGAQNEQTGLQGDTYIDPFYGFSVAWDGQIFDATEMTDSQGTPFGVSLAGSGITASVALGGYGDLRECLDDRLRRLSNIEGVRDIYQSRRVDPLEFGRDVTGAVYQYTYADPDTGHDETYATYFGCEPLLVDGEEQGNVVLTNEFGTRFADFAELGAPTGSRSSTASDSPATSNRQTTPGPA